MKRFYEYLKNLSDAERIPYLHPTTLRLMCEVIEFCDDRKLPCIFTACLSTMAEDSILKRVSDTHRTARAFDMSIRGWTAPDISYISEYFSKKYPQLGAISQDGKTNLIVIHDAGTGLHFHFQIRKDLSLPSIDIWGK